MLHTLSLHFAILVKTSPLTFLHKSLQAMVNFSVVVPEQLWYGFLHSEARVNAFFSGTDRNQYYSSPYAVLPHGSFTKPTVHDVNTKHNFLRVFRWCRDISRGSRGDHVYFFSQFSTKHYDYTHLNPTHPKMSSQKFLGSSLTDVCFHVCIFKTTESKMF